MTRSTMFILIGVAICAAGCNWLTPIVFVGEHKKKVTAEFDKLPGSRVAVHVWTDPAILFDYPHARFEIATYVAEKLALETEQRSQRVQLVDTRDVEDHVQRDLDAAVDPIRVGKKFDADYVIYLEILTFQIRDPQQPQLLRGLIASSVAVHDLRGPQPERFELAPVESVYPEGTPIIYSATNAPLVREMIYRKFAEEVARKFYDYTVDMR